MKTLIAVGFFSALLLSPCTAQRPPKAKVMDYGPCLAGTWTAKWPKDNVALKGLSIRVDGGEAHVVFDTELLRVSAIAMDFKRELRGTAYDGAHGPTPKLVGRQIVATRTAPGWAKGGSFADPRTIPHGPLPRDWGRYRGMYRHGKETVLRYDVAGCDVLEHFTVVGKGATRALVRTLGLGASKQAMVLNVGGRDGATPTLLGDQLAVFRYAKPKAGVTGIALAGAGEGARLRLVDGEVRLELPARSERQQLRLLFTDQPLAEGAGSPDAALVGFKQTAAALAPAESLIDLTRGGPAQWSDPVVTVGKLGTGSGAYLVDRLGVPSDKAAESRLRFGAFDFFADGRAALSTWNGDVWILSGIDAGLEHLEWRRFASGLFDPLGLKIVDGVIHTLGRDGISRLHDLNGDGEADFYECFNNDVLITKAFHEFAFDLQTDAAGNFYFSKGGPVKPGGRGFDKLVPHHGCILRVSKDGSELDVFATGLRAPNGIAVGPDGVVTSGDNEGTWMPACRLNWMKKGSFNGCVDTAHRDPKPTRYDNPLCFLPMRVDNSGGGQVWITTDKWGPFQGELLHLSYGQSTLYKVMREEVDGEVQGGVTPFPLKFTSSCMRARVHPTTGQLFVCGFRGWQTNAVKMTGFDRVRYTGKPVQMLTGLRTAPDGVYLTFTCELDRETAEDPESYEAEVWNYLWTKNYGSPEVSTLHPDPKAKLGSKPQHDGWKVAKATLQADGKTVFLKLPDIRPVMQLRIKFDVDTADGGSVRSEMHSSIHKLPAK